MSSDIRIVKFKKFIEKIWNDSGRAYLISDNIIASKDDSVWLATIYDYEKLNEYGKMIMNQASGSGAYKTYYDLYSDIEYRIDQANWIISDSTGTMVEEKRILFIFWALMILTVDDTDKEEHLSLICDFAKMWRISDVQMLDIIQVIRVIYNKETPRVLQNYYTKNCFKMLLAGYGYYKI